MNDELVVDVELHRRLGFRILTKDEVDARPRSSVGETWPSRRDPPFDPRGISQKEAASAMQRCR